jgi:hypothetical protein
MLGKIQLKVHVPDVPVDPPRTRKQNSSRSPMGHPVVEFQTGFVRRRQVPKVLGCLMREGAFFDGASIQLQPQLDEDGNPGFQWWVVPA